MPGIDDLLGFALHVSWRLLVLLGRVRARRENVRRWNVLFAASGWIRTGSLTLFSFGFLRSGIGVDDLFVFAHRLPTCLIPVLVVRLLTGLLLSLRVVVVEEKGTSSAEQRANEENHTDDDDNHVDSRTLAEEIQTAHERGR